MKKKYSSIKIQQGTVTYYDVINPKGQIIATTVFKAQAKELVKNLNRRMQKGG